MKKILFIALAISLVFSCSKKNEIKPIEQTGTLKIGKISYPVKYAYLIEYTGGGEPDEYQLIVSDFYLDTASNQPLGDAKTVFDVSLELSNSNFLLSNSYRYSRCIDENKMNCIIETLITTTNPESNVKKEQKFLNGVMNINSLTNSNYKIEYKTVISSTKDTVLLDYSGKLNFIREEF